MARSFHHLYAEVMYKLNTTTITTEVNDLVYDEGFFCRWVEDAGRVAERIVYVPCNSILKITVR